MKAKRSVASIAATLRFIVGGISMESYEKATMEIGPRPNVRMERGVVTALEETSESAWRMELTVEEADDASRFVFSSFPKTPSPALSISPSGT